MRVVGISRRAPAEPPQQPAETNFQQARRGATEQSSGVQSERERWQWWDEQHGRWQRRRLWFHGLWRRVGHHGLRWELRRLRELQWRDVWRRWDVRWRRWRWADG